MNCSSGASDVTDRLGLDAAADYDHDEVGAIDMVMFNAGFLQQMSRIATT
jgi:NADP-dependent 3-hydroxy acid dehydrogenase YdfG